MKNIVMITLDAVRPDHLGCYGYKGVDTPNIDWLAENGVVFEQAICQAPNTWVSHASIFTGCNPYRHGIRSPYNKFSSQVVTLAQTLQEAGYVTAGFPAHSLVGSAGGFNRGFSCFEESGFLYYSDIDGAKWHPDWKNVASKIEDWINTHRQERFFCWIHYMDTHKLPEVHIPEFYKKSYSPAWQFYDGKISYADEVCIGWILRLLEDLRILKETIVVIFSDHGEELKNRVEPVHDNKISEEVIKIPLIMYIPSGSFKDKRVKSQVRSIDIMPTLLELVGIDPIKGMEGISLTPLFKNNDISQWQTHEAYIENLPKGYIGIRTEEWKLILKTDAETDAVTPELFNIIIDPEEKVNLAESHIDKVSELCSLLEKTFEDLSTMSFEETEEREKIEATLKTLGYM